MRAKGDTEGYVGGDGMGVVAGGKVRWAGDGREKGESGREEEHEGRVRRGV